MYGASVSASESEEEEDEEDEDDEDEDGMSNLDVLLDINQNKLEPRSPSSSPSNRRVLGADPGPTFQNIDQNIQKNEVVLDGGIMNDNMSKRVETMKSVIIRDGVRDMSSGDVTGDGKDRDKDRGSGRDKMGDSERAEVHTSTLSPSSSSSSSSSEVLAKEGEGCVSHQANSARRRCGDSSSNDNGNDDEVNGVRNSVGKSTGDERSKKGCYEDTKESNSNGSDKTDSTTVSRNTVSEWRGKNDENSTVLEKKNHKIEELQEEKKRISNIEDVSKTNGNIHGNDDDVSFKHHENNENYEITDVRTMDGLHELHGWYDVLGTHTASSSECSRLLSLSPLHSVMKQHTPIARKSFFSFSRFTGKHGNKVKSLYPAILIVTST